MMERVPPNDRRMGGNVGKSHFAMMTTITSGKNLERLMPQKSIVGKMCKVTARFEDDWSFSTKVKGRNVHRRSGSSMHVISEKFEDATTLLTPENTL